MSFSEYFPIWRQLTPEQQEMLSRAVIQRTFPQGTLIHNGSADCTGLVLVRTGQLRAYLLSEEGREITLFRLFDRDLCLFSASCMMNSVQFDLTIYAEKDSDVWIVPADVYQRIQRESAPLANYTNEIMASRFSEVMWLMDQILWKRLDQRLAHFLLEERALEETDRLTITHEIIGNHLGSPREVITRMLRYFQKEGLVKLSRGAVELVDVTGLEALSRF